MTRGEVGRLPAAMLHATALLAAGLLVSACAIEPPPELPSTPESRAAAGAEWFEIYCVSCHGESARGDGPVAAALRIPPADLTGIAARNGGVFESATVAAFIDGRERIAAHGPGDMPVWGRRFDDRTQRTFADETLLPPGTIYLIVEYLLSIQEE